MIRVVTSRPFGRPAPEPSNADAIKGVQRLARSVVYETVTIGPGTKQTGGCAGTPAVALNDGAQCGTGSNAFVLRANGVTVPLNRPQGNGGGGAPMSAAAVITSGAAPTPPMWVVMGSGADGLLTSLDGITWTAVAGQPAGYGYALCYGGGRWVSPGYGYSLDGLTWVAASSDPGTNVGVCWNGSIYVSVGAGGISTSSDGDSWSAADITASPNFSGSGVAWNGSLFIAVGGDTVTGDGLILKSATGAVWTVADAVVFAAGSGAGVCWGGSKWVAVGNGANTVATSPDGTTWTGGGSGLETFDTGGNDVAWNGKYFLAVGSGTGGSSSRRIVTSPDGSIWSALSPDSIPRTSFSFALKRVAWNGKLWVIAGSQLPGVIYCKNENGIGWTKVTPGLYDDLSAFALACHPAPKLTPALP